MKFLKKLSYSTLLSALCSALIVTPVFADLPDATLDRYAENGVYYYDPEGATITCTTNTSKNYSGANILNSQQMAALNANKQFYEQATAEYGFSWQILAVLHYKEYNLQRSNPENGQGVYQLYTYTAGGTNSNAFLPAGEIDDEEFLRQSKIAASIVKDLITELSNEDSTFNIDTSDGVKRLFFRYNGRAQKYVDKAVSMGFSKKEAANGEGSPYVMNRYDAQRDPFNTAGMSPFWPGMYIGDGEWSDTATSESFGAFTVFESIGGTGTCGGELISGGVTSLEQAKEFMQKYIDYLTPPAPITIETCQKFAIDCYNTPGGDPKANCTTFSEYFISQYTSAGVLSGGNGGQVVSSLLASGKGFEDGGRTPRAYAIFSRGGGTGVCTDSDWSGCGHTGVVLGIDKANNKIYIGQAAWGSDLDYCLNFIEQDLSVYTDGAYTYAYTDTILNLH